MAEDVDTFATVYVHGAQDRWDLARAVAEILDGDVDDWCTVTTPGLEVQARDSDEHSPDASAEFPVGFYSFPFLLEFEFSAETGIDAAVRTVSQILKGLWARGWAAVVTAEYVDQLPNEGGLTEDLPWPRK